MNILLMLGQIDVLNSGETPSWHKKRRECPEKKVVKSFQDVMGLRVFFSFFSYGKIFMVLGIWSKNTEVRYF